MENYGSYKFMHCDEIQSFTKITKFAEITKFYAYGYYPFCQSKGRDNPLSSFCIVCDVQISYDGFFEQF